MSVVIACTVSKKHNLAFVYPVSLCVLILGLTAPSSLQYSQKIAPHSCSVDIILPTDGDTATLTAYYLLSPELGTVLYSN